MKSLKKVLFALMIAVVAPVFFSCEVMPEASNFTSGFTTSNGYIVKGEPTTIEFDYSDWGEEAPIKYVLLLQKDSEFYYSETPKFENVVFNRSGKQGIVFWPVYNKQRRTTDYYAKVQVLEIAPELNR